MSQQLIDDNGITDFVDDNGVTYFVDDNGNFLGTAPVVTNDVLMPQACM